MSDTKACNLTQDEIEELINFHGRNVSEDMILHIERLGYLHKRLKAFSEPEIKEATQMPTKEAIAAPANPGSAW